MCKMSEPNPIMRIPLFPSDREPTSFSTSLSPPPASNSSSNWSSSPILPPPPPPPHLSSSSSSSSPSSPPLSPSSSPSHSSLSPSSSSSSNSSLVDLLNEADTTKHGNKEHLMSNLMKIRHAHAHAHEHEVTWADGGIIIIGAGPAGLATAACLKMQGIPSLILEREDCIGSLWRYKSYDRLRLHIAKQFCELPHLKFPDSFPTFPTREQFLEYLEAYAMKFGIKPRFNEAVVSAGYDAHAGVWRVECIRAGHCRRTFVGKFLVAATGENSLPVWPSNVPGLSSFHGKVCHSSEFKSGEEFQGKRVLVVGSGNSGLEVALDLANHQAQVFLSVRSQVHILPRVMLGFSTFTIAMTLLKFFSLRWTDKLLLGMSRVLIGETRKLGFPRPRLGPMEIKSTTGKTPSLDAGTLAKIRQGHIKVLCGIQEFTSNGCTFNDACYQDIDAVIFATGFKSNVPSWLKDSELFSKDGFPHPNLQCKWKGKNGLYSAGFSRKGLVGTSMDAQRIAVDINRLYQQDPSGMPRSS